MASKDDLDDIDSDSQSSYTVQFFAIRGWQSSTQQIKNTTRWSSLASFEDTSDSETAQSTTPVSGGNQTGRINQPPQLPEASDAKKNDSGAEEAKGGKPSFGGAFQMSHLTKQDRMKLPKAGRKGASSPKPMEVVPSLRLFHALMLSPRSCQRSANSHMVGGERLGNKNKKCRNCGGYKIT
eukprot:GHVN01065823.1.p3 GENE.GHVN01065823.1~~GHVN01065823.1.p3  ORF type:complete len:181 (+),score=30.58 GHVN01065823.1:3630-4172(+)